MSVTDIANNVKQFIRHPVDIPIFFHIIDAPSHYSSGVKGLSFISNKALASKTWLHVSIPVNSDVFEVDVQVYKCIAYKEGYLLSVLFANEKEAFTTRMVEQRCYIEHYRKMVLNQEERRLSEDEAASEWIEKYANRFPNFVNH